MPLFKSPTDILIKSAQPHAHIPSKATLTWSVMLPYSWPRLQEPQCLLSVTRQYETPRNSLIVNSPLSTFVLLDLFIYLFSFLKGEEVKSNYYSSLYGPYHWPFLIIFLLNCPCCCPLSHVLFPKCPHPECP